MIFRLIKFLKFHAAMGQEPWKVRQRVKLEPGYYAPSQVNPCRGSLHECEGTVIKIRKDAASVKWDTGHTTIYIVGSERYSPLYITNFPIKLKSLKTKLIGLHENNPNITFKKQKEQQQIQNAKGLFIV